MSKGSKRRPKIVTDEQFKEAWDNIFVRKVQPKHSVTKPHTDRTKYNRKKLKQEQLKDDYL